MKRVFTRLDPARGRTGHSVARPRATERRGGLDAGAPAEPVQEPLLWQVIKLTYFDASAQAVAVAGTFNDWQPEALPMMRERDGHWSATIRLTPGTYEYRLIVDGQWRDDPLARRRVANPFGGMNAVLEVEGSDP